MPYQCERPFVMDSGASEAALDLRPTPLDEAARLTVEWWKSDRGVSSPAASRT